MAGFELTVSTSTHITRFECSIGLCQELPAISAFKSFISKNKWNESVALGSNSGSINLVWDELFPAEQANIVRTLVERITIRREGISIQWKADGMNTLLRETLSEPERVAA